MKRLLLVALIFGSLIGIANYSLMASADAHSKSSTSGLIDKYDGTVRNKFHQVKKQFKVNLKFYDQQNNTSIIEKKLVLPKGTGIVSHGKDYYQHYVVDNPFDATTLRNKLHNGLFKNRQGHFNGQVPASKVKLMTHTSQSQSSTANQSLADSQLPTTQLKTATSK